MPTAESSSHVRQRVESLARQPEDTPRGAVRVRERRERGGGLSRERRERPRDERREIRLERRHELVDEDQTLPQIRRGPRRAHVFHQRRGVRKRGRPHALHHALEVGDDALAHERIAGPRGEASERGFESRA